MNCNHYRITVSAVKSPRIFPNACVRAFRFRYQEQFKSGRAPIESQSRALARASVRRVPRRLKTAGEPAKEFLCNL